MTSIEIDLTPQLAAALAQYETARERRIAALTAGPWWSHARADDECSVHARLLADYLLTAYRLAQ